MILGKSMAFSREVLMQWGPVYKRQIAISLKMTRMPPKIETVIVDIFSKKLD